MSEEQVMQQSEVQPSPSPLIFMDSVEPTQTKWLWYPYIPLGKLTIIMGDPGEGKSTFALALAAAVTKGLRFPEPVMDTNAEFVLYQNAEDGLSDTIRPRLDKAGADPHMVLTIDEMRSSADMQSTMLYDVISRIQPRLVILDPLQAYLGAEVDMHRANEIRPVMHYLGMLAEKFGCAIVLIGHMNKRSDVKSAYRSIGSIDLTAAARSVLLIARDPAHPEHRVIKQVKNSLAPEGDTVSFTIGEDGKFCFEGRYEVDTETLLSQRERRETECDRAVMMLKKWLTEYGQLPASEVYRLADSEGISKRTVVRAKQILHITSRRDQTQWIWALPK